MYSGANTYLDAFNLSVETISTIGFGNIVPNSVYLHMLVFIQSWVSLFSDGIIVAVVIAKISRPSYDVVLL